MIKKQDRVTPKEKLTDPQVQKDLQEVMMRLVSCTVTDESGMAKEAVKILSKYVK